MDVKERGAKLYVKVDESQLYDDENEMTATNHAPRVEFYEPDSDEEDGNGRKGTCADNCWCLACLFLVSSVAIGSLSVIFDWLWVADMFKAEQALVFGPASTGVKVALTIMATFGTITYICENGDKIYSFFKKKEIFDEQAEETMSLFLEEVPQMTLNLLLSMCREIPTSYFQLLKAALGMASTALRLIKAMCYAFGCKTPKKSRRQLRLFGRVLLIAACIYTFAAGIAVFVFMYKEPEHGNMDSRFYAPANVFGDAYNTERYFPNSGVFFTHPTLSHCRDGNQHTSNTTKSTNWIRIEVIYTFLLLKVSSLEATYSYNDTTAMFGVRSVRRQQCYKINLSDCKITPVYTNICTVPVILRTTCGYGEPILDYPNNSSDNSTNSTDGSTSISTASPCKTESAIRNPNVTKLYLIFHRTPISKTHVFGDIKYNGTSNTGNGCAYVTGDKFGNLYDKGELAGQIQYFKAPYTVNTTIPVKYNNNTTSYHLFQYPQDLNNVTEAWRTGYKNCEMTGALAPNPRDFQFDVCAVWNDNIDLNPNKN